MAGLIYKELWHDKKVRGWSDAQLRLWLMSISYAEDHASNGFLDEADVTLVLTTQNIARAVVGQLIEARGLDQVGDRYRIHNYGRRGKLSRTRAIAGQKGGSKTASKFAQANAQAIALANTGVGVEVVIRKIFEVWVGTLGGRRVTLTVGRIRVIRARLNEGFSEADLIDATQGWQNDPWPERSRQNDLTILFRNGEQVEKFRDLWRSGPPPSTAKAPSDGARALFLAAERERRAS